MSGNMKANLVIVGGGAAGLTAAVAAAEAGVKNIIILESRKGIGGNGNFVLGMFAADSKIQNFLGIECRKDDVFKEQMHYHHWKTDPRLLRTLINKTADTVAWLEDKGVVWGGVLSHFPGQTPRAHHYATGYNTTGAAIMDKLRQACEKLSVKILTQTRGKRLLIDGNGNITDVIAGTKDGEMTIHTKSVIVATGGLYGNKDLIKKAIPWPQTYEPEEFITWGLDHPGDGFQMLTEVGAAREGRVIYEMHAPIFFGELRLPAYVLPISHLTVWVNKNGDRFADETISDLFSESANAVVRQPDKVMYSVFDENILQRIIGRGFSEFELVVGALLPGGVPANAGNIPAMKEEFARDLKKEAEKGLVEISESWEEIAKFIGADPKTLKATIDEYNVSCDQGHDKLFDKDRETLVPLRTPPFYAMKCGACINTVHGDIKVNYQMQVLNQQDNPIGGLYAAGVDVGTADWGTYNTHFTGHSFGFSVNGGRLAGESAAKYVLSK